MKTKIKFINNLSKEEPQVIATLLGGIKVVGMPLGGKKGQVLTKNSDLNNDASWQDPQGGGGTPVDLSKYATIRYVDNNIDYLFKAIDQVFLGVTPVFNILQDNYIIDTNTQYINNDYPLNILSGKSYVLTAKITYTDKTVSVVEMSDRAEISSAITTLQLVGPDNAFELNICNGAQYISNKLTAADGKSCIVGNGLASNIESIELITLYQASANLIKSPVDITILTGEPTEYPFIDYKLDIDLTKLYDVELVYKLNGEEVTQTFRGMFMDNEAEIGIADTQMGMLFVANQYETEFGNAETDAGFMLIIYNGIKMDMETGGPVAGDYCTIMAQGMSETASTVFTDVKLTKITESKIPAFENPVITNAKELLSHIPMQPPAEMEGGMMYRSNMSIEPGTTYDITVSFVAGGNEYVHKMENTLPYDVIDSTIFNAEELKNLQASYYPVAPIKYIFGGDGIDIDTEANTEPLTENGYFRFRGQLMVAKDNTLVFYVGSFRGRDWGSEAKYENKLPTEIKFNFNKNLTIPTKDFTGWPLALDLTNTVPIGGTYLFNYNGTFNMQPLSFYKLCINEDCTDAIPLRVIKYLTTSGDIYQAEYDVENLFRIEIVDHASVLNGTNYSENNCGIVFNLTSETSGTQTFYALNEATEDDICDSGEYVLPLTVSGKKTYKGHIGLEDNKLYIISTSNGDIGGFSETVSNATTSEDIGTYIKIDTKDNNYNDVIISDGATYFGTSSDYDSPMQYQNGVAVKTGTNTTINSITAQAIPTIGNTMTFPITFSNVPEDNGMTYNTIGQFTAISETGNYEINITIDGEAKTITAYLYTSESNSDYMLCSKWTDGVEITVFPNQVAYTYGTNYRTTTKALDGYCYWAVSVKKPDGSDGTTKHTVVLNSITKVN